MEETAMTDTSITMTEETKATVLSLLQQHFNASLRIDEALQFVDDGPGHIRSASWDQETAIGELTELLGIDPLDVTAPVVAKRAPELSAAS
jgi:hypothetical protein